MAEQKVRWRVGLFVLVGMGLLIFLLFIFGGAPTLFVPRDTYTVVFSDAPGIQSGTPVRRSGVTVGEVEELSLDPKTGLVRVTLRMDPDYPPRTNEDITFSRNLISGDATIDLIPKDPEKRPIDLGEPIEPGTELVGLNPPNARRLLTQATDVLPTAQESLDQIRRSLEKFDELTPRVEEAVVAFRDLGRSGSELVAELRRTNDAARDILVEVQEARPRIAQTNEELQALLRNSNNFVTELRQVVQLNEPRVRKLVDEVTNTVTEVSEVFNEENRQNLAKTLENVSTASERFEPIARGTDEGLEQLRKTLQRLDNSLTDVEVILKDIRKTTQPLGERSEHIVQNIDSSLDQLNGVLMDFRELMRAAARADGTLQRLIGDPTLYAQTTTAVNGVVKLLPRVERILADVEVFADKIARHPERIGVGGAVRPSTGLKDSPYDR